MPLGSLTALVFAGTSHLWIRHVDLGIKPVWISCSTNRVVAMPKDLDFAQDTERYRG